MCIHKKTNRNRNGVQTSRAFFSVASLSRAFTRYEKEQEEVLKENCNGAVATFPPLAAFDILVVLDITFVCMSHTAYEVLVSSRYSPNKFMFLSLPLTN